MKEKLKTKEFKLKPKVLDFSSVQSMTDLEKKKIYIGFVKLLNNHFKWSCFNKALYHYFTSHCGFIAHHNIYGFYGEYFETAASFHFNVNGYLTPMHECMGNVNRKSTLSNGEQFYAIYEEMNGSRNGIGAFIDTLLSNQSWGGNSAYADLNRAIKDAISDYKEVWVEEIRKAIKLEHSQKQQVEKVIEEKPMVSEIVKTFPNIVVCRVPKQERTRIQEPIKQETKTKLVAQQPSLFDFMEAA